MNICKLLGDQLILARGRYLKIVADLFGTTEMAGTSRALTEGVEQDRALKARVK